MRGVEGTVTLLIGGLIVRTGVQSGKDAIFVLMDVGPDKTTRHNLLRVIEDVDGVERVKDFRLRRSGPFLFGKVEVEVKPDLDVARSHEIAGRIKEAVESANQWVEYLSVYIEPSARKIQIAAIPISHEEKDVLIRR